MNMYVITAGILFVFPLMLYMAMYALAKFVKWLAERMVGGYEKKEKLANELLNRLRARDTMSPAVKRAFECLFGDMDEFEIAEKKYWWDVRDQAVDAIAIFDWIARKLFGK